MGRVYVVYNYAVCINVNSEYFPEDIDFSFIIGRTLLILNSVILVTLCCVIIVVAMATVLVFQLLYLYSVLHTL